MIYLQISDEFNDLVQPDLLEQTALAVIDHHEVPDPSDLTVVIDSDEVIRKLNIQFRDIDAPTDVLSFPSGEIDPETGNVYLGDIIISYPRAVAQAAVSGHSAEDEIQLLIVHGVLHLLGYVHTDSDEKTIMWNAQE